MDYLINGDIYIKKGPTLIREGSPKKEEPKESAIDYVINSINRCTGYEILIPDDIEKNSMEEFNFVKEEIESLPDYILNKIDLNVLKYFSDMVSYVSLGGNLKDFSQGIDDDGPVYDYSWSDDFWQLFVVQNKIVMQVVNKRKVESKMVFNNVSKMKEHFVRLSDFLSNANYIGREFKRTKPTSNGSKSFMSSSTGVLALYEYDGIILTKKGRFCTLEKYYVDDGNYTFVGDVNEEYRDKDKLYQEIMQQLMEYREEYKDSKKR